MPVPFATLSAVTCQTPDGQTLFENLDLGIGAERTGLIGPNGIGKTSLLRALIGETLSSSGAITVNGSIGYLLQQRTVDLHQTVADAFGIADSFARLVRALSGEASADEVAAVDWALESRFEEALASVGMDSATPDTRLGELSGGQRTRIALAALLFKAPDLLILDEPTNDLDADGRKIVAEVLSNWTGGALVVSHDRELLRRMDRIVELSSVGVRIYGGNWDHYQERKAIEQAAAAADVDHAAKHLRETRKQAQQIKERQARRESRGRAMRAKGDMPKLLLNAMRQRAEATTGRLNQGTAGKIAEASTDVQAAETRLERLSAPKIVLASANVPNGKTMLELSDLSMRFGDQPPLFTGLNLHITGPERVAITGANGTGKSTLLHLISGDIKPESGSVRVHGPLALLDQKVSLLDPEDTIRDNFKRLNPESTETDCRAALARFLFRADFALRKAVDLSGGEKMRAGLACTLGAAEPPQILLLDEPTNHLDLGSIEAIAAGLRAYDGVLIAVSHDPEFLKDIEIQREISFPPEQM